MPLFSPDLLAAWSGGRWTVAPAADISGFTQDTRVLKAGDCFVALRTDKRDGHDFLKAAQDAGAVGAVVSRHVAASDMPQLVVAEPLLAWQAMAREHRKQFARTVVGVTGSCGKTSTKNLAALLLGGAPQVLATEGNFNNHLGVPLTLLKIDSAAHLAAVIEAGISGPGEMDVLGDMIRPDLGIVTLVGPAHLQELGGLEGVAREKSRLLHHVKRSGLAVIPAQCWDYAPFRDLPVPSLVVVPAGAPCGARWQVKLRVEHSSSGTVLWLDERRFTLGPVSPGMAQNAALALAAASELGVSDAQLQKALARYTPAALRGEVRREGGTWYYIDCYNANPASMRDALEAFRLNAPAGEPRLYLLGGMEELGGDAATHHRELGRKLAAGARDEVWIIGTHAAEVAGGLAESGSRAKVELLNDLAPIRERLRTFSGAALVKGSRRYALEQALPFSPPSH
ncbi:MAG: UDP-N-acetylmuramoyl-tripeptide--D-alanyl-D-alanine ligase [Opitutaceae bacterium]|nr:UDP-N-acetylmuramoyl-tripeptide--D-alanyl-D-alanine ligase [Opitutaceae bacterium]